MLLSASDLLAQVNKEVEVTKAYIPTVERVAKPALPAVIIDTAYINPDIDYSVTPLAINSQLQTLPIKPATVTYWKFNKPAIAQVKVGVGYPFNTLLQAYASTQNASVGYAAASVDHDGDYSRIEGVNATQSFNDVAVAAGLYIGDKSLDGNVAYSNDLFYKYAFDQSSSSYINYQQVSTGLRFGDKFVDLTKLNYSFNLDYSHFYDRENNVDNTTRIGVLAGKEIGLGSALFSTDYQYVASSGAYQNQNFALSGIYTWQLSDMALSLGAEYCFDKSEGVGDSASNHYLLPKFTLGPSSSQVISFFAQVDGSVAQNSFSRLSELNPYLQAPLSAASSVEYDFAAGVTGQLKSSVLAYRLYADYKIGVNSRFWGLSIIESSDGSVVDNYFDLELASLRTLAFKVELEYKPTTALEIDLDAGCYAYNYSDDVVYANFRPNFDAALAANYFLRNVTFGLKAQVIGSRDYSQAYYTPSSSLSPQSETITLPVVVDLAAQVDWRVKENMSVFIEGSNLCNADLYPWPAYRGLGMQFTGGVKIKFR